MISKVNVFVAVSACIFVFYISIVSAETIKCFQCNSVKDPECADLTSADTNNSTFYRDCNETALRSGNQPFCRKTKLRILDEAKTVRILRECGTTFYKSNTSRCYEVDTDYKYEVNCQCFEDGCNAAPQRFSRSYFLVFLTLAVGVGITRTN